MSDVSSEERKSSLEKTLSATGESQLPQDFEKLKLYNLSDFKDASQNTTVTQTAAITTHYRCESLFDAIDVDIPTTFADQSKWRDIPENQFFFAEEDGSTLFPPSLIFEILDRQEPSEDDIKHEDRDKDAMLVMLEDATGQDEVIDEEGRVVKFSEKACKKQVERAKVLAEKRRIRRVEQSKKTRKAKTGEVMKRTNGLQQRRKDEEDIATVQQMPKKVELKHIKEETCYSLMAVAEPEFVAEDGVPFATVIMMTLIRFDEEATDFVITINVPHVVGREDVEQDVMKSALTKKAMDYRDRIWESFKLDKAMFRELVGL